MVTLKSSLRYENILIKLCTLCCFFTLTIGEKEYIDELYYNIDRPGLVILAGTGIEQGR